jgi:hypothetical protein
MAATESCDESVDPMGRLAEGFGVINSVGHSRRGYWFPASWGDGGVDRHAV